MNNTCCRIIVSQSCNYNCSYCCNKIDGMIEQFVPINVNDIIRIASAYDSISLTGGETLMPTTINKVIHLAEIVKWQLFKKLYIYTNLHYLPNPHLISLADGWSIGFHPSQTNISDFEIRVFRLIAIGGKGVRVMVEQGKEHLLANLVGAVEIKQWKMNECDKTNIEDWYRIKYETMEY